MTRTAIHYSPGRKFLSKLIPIWWDTKFDMWGGFPRPIERINLVTGVKQVRNEFTGLWEFVFKVVE